MFTDIHVHTRMFMSPILNGEQDFTLPEALVERYDKIGLKKAVLLQIVNPEYSIGLQSNEEIIEISKRYPDRFIPFCSVGPRAMTNLPDAPLGDLLRHYKDMGSKGSSN